MKKRVFLLLIIFSASKLFSQAPTEWFTQARLGLFIHWGVYAVQAKGEWAMHDYRIPYNEYEQIAHTFKPDSFDARLLVQLAKNCGMKYLVITAKHHDGFCMWDTKLTDYNIVKWGRFNRDPIKELAAECAREGLKLGFYYSVRDWHHPEFVLHYEHLEAPGPKYKGWYAFPPSWTNNEIYDCGCRACTQNIPITKEHDPRLTEAEGANMDRYLDYMKGQIKELLTNYGPVAIMWFDGQDIVSSEKSRYQEMVAEMRKLQPKVLINDRIAFDPGMGDYGVFENEIPGKQIIRPWESCMNLNNGPWGYFPNTSWKSKKEIVQTLADIVSRDGNLLLNIAPDGLGRIDSDFSSRLSDISLWLKENGESLYGCYSYSQEKPDWGRITKNTEKVYLHIFKNPQQLTFKLNEGDYFKEAFFLKNRQKLPFTIENNILTLDLPDNLPDTTSTIVVLQPR